MRFALTIARIDFKGFNVTGLPRQADVFNNPVPFLSSTSVLRLAPDTATPKAYVKVTNGTIQRFLTLVPPTIFTAELYAMSPFTASSVSSDKFVGSRPPCSVSFQTSCSSTVR